MKLKLPSLKSKRVRWAIRAMAVLLTVVVLGTVSFNFWAARQKAQAVAELAKQGVTLDQRAEAMPLPPAAENFGALPIFQDLKLEKLPANSMLDDFWMNQITTFRGPARGQAFDPASVKDYLPGATTPEARWEAFEGKNREVLAALKQGMACRYAVSTNQRNYGDDVMALYAAPARDLLRLRKFSSWLKCRAYLAMEVKRPAEALESVLIGRRLADLASTDETLVGKLVGGVLDRDVYQVMANGIDAGIWNEGQLELLEEGLVRRPDLASSWRGTLLMEGWASVALLNQLKSHPELWDTGIAEIVERGSTTSRNLMRLAPRGVLDLTQVRTIQQLGQVVVGMRDGTAMSKWTLGKSLVGESGGSTIGQFLDGEQFKLTGLSILKSSVRSEVRSAQALLACRLALYKAHQGHYPATLAEAGEEGVTDPFSGKPFLYRTEGEKFLLYSVGPNGVDDGGKRERKDQRNPDETADWLW